LSRAHFAGHVTTASQQRKQQSVPFCSLLKEIVKTDVNRQLQPCMSEETNLSASATALFW